VVKDRQEHKPQRISQPTEIRSAEAELDMEAGQ
jgi:hypothetical protein